MAAPGPQPRTGARRGQGGAPAHKAPQRARLTARRDPRAAPAKKNKEGITSV